MCWVLASSPQLVIAYLWVDNTVTVLCVKMAVIKTVNIKLQHHSAVLVSYHNTISHLDVSLNFSRHYLKEQYDVWQHKCMKRLDQTQKILYPANATNTRFVELNVKTIYVITVLIEIKLGSDWKQNKCNNSNNKTKLSIKIIYCKLKCTKKTKQTPILSMKVYYYFISILHLQINRNFTINWHHIWLW